MEEYFILNHATHIYTIWREENIISDLMNLYVVLLSPFSIMIRLIIGIVIGLLIGTYFGIKLQVSDLTWSIPALSGLISSSSKSFLNSATIPNTIENANGIQISESIWSSVSSFFKSPEFQNIVSQIQANPSQTQSILQQVLPSLLAQIIKQKVTASWLSSLSELLWK